MPGRAARFRVVVVVRGKVAGRDGMEVVVVAASVVVGRKDVG